MRWKILILTVRLWVQRVPWWLVAAVVPVAAMLTFILQPIKEPTCLDGMKGNLFGELLGGLVFLFLGFHFGRKVEGIILRRARLDEQREVMERFIDFLEHEAHYNVCFPGLATRTQRHGLVYRLEPARHTGRAAKLETEIERLYVVRVVRPAYEDVLSPEQLADYASAPLKMGGLFFCDFFNGQWHMGPSTSKRDWFEFHLFGKQGEFRRSVTAEEFYAGLTNAPGL